MSVQIPQQVLFSVYGVKDQTQNHADIMKVLTPWDTIYTSVASFVKL